MKAHARLGGLTAEQLDQLDTDGFVVVPEFLTPAEVEAGLAELQTIFPEPTAVAEAPARHSDVAGAPFAGLRDFPYVGTALNAHAVHPKLLALAAYWLGVDDVRLIQARVWAKYSSGDYDQDLHLDYPSHSLVCPRDEPPYRELICFLYYSDVGEQNGATRVVSRRHSGHVVGDAVDRDLHSELYSLEVPATGPSGSLLAYTPLTFHRGANFTVPGLARFIQGVAFASSRCGWIGHQSWPGRAVAPEMRTAIESFSVAQRTAIGFPPPEDAYWTPETCAAVAHRYPGLDMSPYVRE